jgi:hypothetical protein
MLAAPCRTDAQIGEGEAQLVLDGLLAPLGQHEVRLDPGGAEGFQQAHAEDRAGGAGDADDDAFHSITFPPHRNGS